ncbi:MAG: ferredoxin--NADP reductase [Bacteroidia bacterium]|nr:ferredoxin--NADP reductase [Bacteroidia bacterium]MCO5254123.1 ferredoxin--NADP reductase [Bacteroidota bacterium]
MTTIPGFYNLKVKKVNRETDKAVTVFFEIPEIIKDKFHYKAGQFLTIEAEIKNESVRRSYSICTSPYIDSDLAVTIKEVEGGKMSTYINNQLKEGAFLNVMPPNGKFIVEPQPINTKVYILFGGGSGITPLMGIAKTVLSQEPESKVYLIYANQNINAVIFKSALDEMEKQNKDRFKIYYSYDKAPMMWFGLKGFLTESVVVDILKYKIAGHYASAHYYICGPSPMMDVVMQGLVNIDIDATHIHSEYFGATTKHESKVSDVQSEGKKGFSGKAKVQVTLYGKTIEIEVKENQTILDAANAAGLQPPYSCTVGVCTTCRAKVLKGKVEMMEREGLSDSEIDEGYILTCQSLPRSEEIQIIYE